MGRMVLRNGRRRFQWAVVESFGLGVEDFGCGGFWTDKAFRVVNMVLDLGIFKMGVAPERPGDAEDRDGFRDLWMSQKKLLVVWTRIVIMIVVKFWPLYEFFWDPKTRLWDQRVNKEHHKIQKLPLCFRDCQGFWQSKVSTNPIPSSNHHYKPQSEYIAKDV